jgi:hypothetical protein
MKTIGNHQKESGTEYAGAYACVPMDIAQDVRLAQIYSADEFKQLDNVESPLTNYIHVDRVGLIELFPVFPPLLVISLSSFYKFRFW